MKQRATNKAAKSEQEPGEKQLRAGERRTVKFALEGTVTAAEFAELLGVSDQTLRNYAANGMPKASRGRYPLRDAMRWIKDRDEKRAAAQASDGPTHADIRRDLDLLKLRKAQGEVFDRREVVDVMTSGAVRLGVALENLATMIGRELNLPGDDVKMIRDLVDEMRTQYVRDCGEFIDDGESGPPGHAGRAAAGVTHLPG